MLQVTYKELTIDPKSHTLLNEKVIRVQHFYYYIHKN